MNYTIGLVSVGHNIHHRAEAGNRHHQPDSRSALSSTAYFEDYDQQKHVESLLTTFLLLPRITFRVNNYHTKTVRYKDGHEISRETFAYAYNQQGYPTQKTRNGSGDTITSTYMH